MIDLRDIDLIMDNVPFKRLTGARVLITGGSGFIGSWLAVAPPDVKIVRLDHTQYDFGNWDKKDWDYIIHLAPPLPMRVIRCAARCGAKILYASSGAVYDRERGEYANTKLLGERQLEDWAGKYSIARMFTFTGAYMRNHFAVINYITDALGGGPIKIRGDNVTRSYMYAADMAVWLWRILLDGTNGIYEVGGSVPCTMFELAHEIRHHFQPMPHICYDRIYGPDARPVYLPHGLEATAQELNLSEYTTFGAGILRTVEWYRRYLHGLRSPA
jgi:nucleoside-diphosphate-sugar epimerase